MEAILKNFLSLFEHFGTQKTSISKIKQPSEKGKKQTLKKKKSFGTQLPW